MSYDPALYPSLAELEPTSFWFAGRRRLILLVLEQCFGDARSLLDVGCGTGDVLASLHDARPELELAGCDELPEGIAIARRRLPDVPFYEADARRLPFDREFDVVCALDVLEHVAEDERVLAELHRTVRPGGGVVLTVPQHRWLWSAADERAGHRRRYSRRELLGKLRAAGFRIRRATSFISLLLPGMAISRRLSGDEYDLLAEHRRAQRFAPVLNGVLALERRLIARGLSLPAGGSLLVTAERPA